MFGLAIYDPNQSNVGREKKNLQRANSENGAVNT